MSNLEALYVRAKALNLYGLLAHWVEWEEPDLQWKAAAFVRWHKPDESRGSSPVL